MKNKFEVFKVTDPNDFKKCHNIRKTVFVEEQNVPLELEIQGDDSSEHFLCLVDGKALGTGRIRLKDSFIKFERIATLRESRGLGVGKALMDLMVTYVQEKYPKFMPMMHAQLNAVDFYKKIGWIEIGDLFYEAGIPHKIMIFLANDTSTKNFEIWNCTPDTFEEKEILKYLNNRI